MRIAQDFRVKIDAFAHISPVRYLERIEPILAGPGASAAVSEHGPWLRADPVLFDLDARWRALEQFGDYRQVLVLAAPPLEELGEPAVTRDLARLPFHDQLLAGRADADAELRFQLFEVLVVGAEERLSPFLGDLNLAHDGGWHVSKA